MIAAIWISAACVGVAVLLLSVEGKRMIAFRLLAVADAQEEFADAYRRRLEDLEASQGRKEQEYA